jgi:hypothetical protein
MKKEYIQVEGLYKPGNARAEGGDEAKWWVEEKSNNSQPHVEFPCPFAVPAPLCAYLTST